MGERRLLINLAPPARASMFISSSSMELEPVSLSLQQQAEISKTPLTDSPMAMLKKLRRGSKILTDGTTSTPRQDSISFSPPETTATNKEKLTFFDLPAELRNDIYDLVAKDTTLRLPSRLNKARTKEPPPIAGLLIASRQCRTEFLPLLYATSTFLVEIKDFGFRNLMRVVSSLYSTELKALRDNPNLVIQLRTQNCTRDNIACLRQWLVARADSLDRLPWNYEVVDDGPVTDAGRIRLLQELAYYIRIMTRLNEKLEGTVQWELDAIMAAFVKKSSMLHTDILTLNKRGIGSPQQVRGLSGGGLR